MRITREILLGIGIGLIISSLLMLIFFPAPVVKDNVQPLNFNPPVFAEKITVIIPKGTDSEKIASILADSQVIKSPKDFSQMAKALKVENKFIAGNYTFNKDEELSNVIRKLIEGPRKE